VDRHLRKCSPLSIPFIVAMTLPMAVLVAVLYTFSTLAADNEVTAMKASGISVQRLLAPVDRGATVVALISLFWNGPDPCALQSPAADAPRRHSTQEADVSVEGTGDQRKSWPANSSARRPHRPAANTLNDVTIYDLGDPERRRIILADSGRMAYTPGGTDCT